MLSVNKKLIVTMACFLPLFSQGEIPPLKSKLNSFGGKTSFASGTDSSVPFQSQEHVNVIFPLPFPFRLYAHPLSHPLETSLCVPFKFPLLSLSFPLSVLCLSVSLFSVSFHLCPLLRNNSVFALGIIT